MTDRLEVLIAPPEILPLYQSLIFRGHPIQAVIDQHNPTRAQLLKVLECMSADRALYKRAATSVQFDPIARAIPKISEQYTETLVAALFRWVYQQGTIEDALNTRGLNADKDPKHRRYLVKMVRDMTLRLSMVHGAIAVMVAPPPKRQLQNTYGLNPNLIEDEAERKRLARNDNHVLKLLGKRGMQARKVAWKYNLSTEEAFKLLGRDCVGRPLRG